MDRTLLMQDIEELAKSRLNEIVLHCGSRSLLESAKNFSQFALESKALQGYNWLSDAALTTARDVQACGGDEALRIMLRMSLLESCIRLIKSSRYLSLPERVFLNHSGALVRIAGSSDCELPWLSPSSNLFKKEMGIANFRLIVVGGRVIDLHSGVPRRILTQGGVGGFLKASKALFRLGGFYPVLQTHIHDFLTSRVDEGERIQQWLGCADILKFHPSVRGMFNTGWLHDPALEFATPRLYQDSRIMRENGGMYIPGGMDPDTTENALAKSARRQSLYAQGLYMPQRYHVIWPRDQLINWADQWVNDHPDHPGVLSPGA